MNNSSHLNAQCPQGTAIAIHYIELHSALGELLIIPYIEMHSALRELPTIHYIDIYSALREIQTMPYIEIHSALKELPITLTLLTYIQMRSGLSWVASGNC